jgi:hypothetical protein
VTVWYAGQKWNKYIEKRASSWLLTRILLSNFESFPVGFILKAHLQYVHEIWTPWKLAIHPKGVLCGLDCRGYVKDFQISQSCKIKETKDTLLIYTYISTQTHTHTNTNSGACYNERMLKGRVFINKIRMLQRTQMLKRMWWHINDRRGTRVHMTCRSFPIWLERQSSSLSSFVRFSYQFSSVISLVQLSV